jgi:hypothetical protein
MRGVLLGLAEGANDGEAVGAGKHAVEDDGGDVFFGVFFRRGIFFSSEEVGEGGVAVGFVMGAVALGLEVEEEALGEVFFVFDDDDEGSGGLSHGMLLSAKFGVGIEDKGISNNKCKDEMRGFFPIRLRSGSE